MVLKVYLVTKKYPSDERFRLVDQSCRAAISFPANIAEGFKRKCVGDSLRFYNIALASLEELKYHLLLAKDLDYMSLKEYDGLFKNLEECGRLLYGWMKVQK